MVICFMVGVALSNDVHKHSKNFFYKTIGNKDFYDLVYATIDGRTAQSANKT